MKIDHILDVNGTVCPIPAANTRNFLRKMESGKILEIIGDFEPALINVIQMAEKNGAEILEQDSKTDFFRVVVKKK